MSIWVFIFTYCFLFLHPVVSIIVGFSAERCLERLFSSLKTKSGLVKGIVFVAFTILAFLVIVVINGIVAPPGGYLLVYPKNLPDRIQFIWNRYFGAPYVVCTSMSEGGEYYLMDFDGEIIRESDLYEGEDTPIYTARSIFGVVGHYVIDLKTSQLITNKINVNGCKRSKSQNKSSNLYEENSGRFVDGYQDISVTVNGVTQDYCLDRNHKLLTNAYRTMVNEDGSGLIGTAYYSGDGLFYTGWISLSGSGRKRVLSYQSTVQVRGRSVPYLVTNLQKLPGSSDPDDALKKIPGGWYLFDEYGRLVNKEGKCKKFDAVYMLDERGIVETVDDRKPEEYLAAQRA